MSEPPDFNSLPPGLEAAVFGHLSARSLALASCVCRQWRELSSERQWRQLYGQLWPVPAAAAGGGAQLPPAAAGAAAAEPWQRLYGERQLLSRCWLGRPAIDKLSGHTSAAKACRLLPELGLLFTGGVDRLVRAWDLHSGIQLACSRRHAGTVRCLAADSRLLASGSSDHNIRVWQRRHRGSAAGAGAGSSSSGGGMLFDLVGDKEVLAGHTGPVSSLQLTSDALISGSWDCSIRVWDRRTLECTQLLHTDDWVSSLALGGDMLAAACGKEVLLYRLDGSSLHRVGSLTCPANSSSTGGGSSGGGRASPAAASAAITAVGCSADGCTVFFGTVHGSVWAADVRACIAGGSGSASARPVLLLQQAAEVAGLTWDHPWLAVADRAGSVVLLDAGMATAAGAAAVEGSSSSGSSSGGSKRSKAGGSSGFTASGRKQQRQIRVLHAGGMGSGAASAAAQCVSLAGSWAAAGFDCGTIITWDGSKGLQQQAAAAAARQQKAERRQRNQERQQRQKQGGSRPSAAAGEVGIISGGGRPAPAGAGAPQHPPTVHATPKECSPAQQDGSIDPAASLLLVSEASGQAAEAGSQLQQSSRPVAARPARAASVRVPAPVRPDAVAAAVVAAGGTCRQQAWQVLRSTRSVPALPVAASGHVASGPAGQHQLGPTSEPA